MGVVTATPLNLNAVTVSGLATVVFPARSYRRGITSIAMINPAGGSVTIYRGTINAFTFVTSNPVGGEQTYSVPFILPAGQGLFVQWSNSPSPVSLARAVLTWLEEKP